MRTRISSICCLVCALFLSLLFAQRYHLSPWFRCHTICIQICAIYVHISSTHKPQLKRHWTGTIVLTGAIYIYVDSFKTNTTVRIQLSNESHNFVSMLQWNIPADGLLPLMPTWDAGGGGGANKVAGLSSFTVTQIFYMASPLFDTASFREMMHQVSPPVKEIIQWAFYGLQLEIAHRSWDTWRYEENTYCFSLRENKAFYSKLSKILPFRWTTDEFNQIVYRIRSTSPLFSHFPIWTWLKHVRPFGKKYHAEYDSGRVWKCFGPRLGRNTDSIWSLNKGCCAKKDLS